MRLSVSSVLDAAAKLRRRVDVLRFGETGYRVGRDLDGSSLGEWPVYSDPKLNLDRIVGGCYADPPFDGNGIVRFLVRGVAVEQPGTIALCALNGYHGMLGGDASHDYAAIFRRHAEWLRGNLEIETGVGRWWYDFVPPRAERAAAGAWHVRDGPNGPRWVSCFAQAFGLSIMLRAHQRFGDDGYRDAADAAAQTFRVPLEELGVLHREGERLFFEEYPEKRPAHVLNGFLSGILSLQEYARRRDVAWAMELAQSAARTAAALLPRYEAAKGLRYDLVGDALVNDDYATFVLRQLEALRRTSGMRRFGRVARRWRRRRWRQLAKAGARAAVESVVALRR